MQPLHYMNTYVKDLEACSVLSYGYQRVQRTEKGNIAVFMMVQGIEIGS